MAELSRLRIALIVCIVDGLGRPDADVAVYAVSVFLCRPQTMMIARTHLHRPRPTSFHRARHGSCKLRNLSVRLRHANRGSATFKTRCHNGLDNALLTAMAQPRWLDKMHTGRRAPMRMVCSCRVGPDLMRKSKSPRRTAIDVATPLPAVWAPGMRQVPHATCCGDA